MAQMSSKMIHRRYDQGEVLDVAGLNEITVLIDRSCTARAELGLNTWTPGQDSPPHQHEAKEQIFFVLEGSGEVTVDGETRPVTVGDVVFVPWKAPHTTQAGPVTALQTEQPTAFLPLNFNTK
jgi:quercetin dioxygenase-like cupin family protein